MVQPALCELLAALGLMLGTVTPKGVRNYKHTRFVIASSLFRAAETANGP